MLSLFTVVLVQIICATGEIDILHVQVTLNFNRKVGKPGIFLYGRIACTSLFVKTSMSSNLRLVLTWYCVLCYNHYNLQRRQLALVGMYIKPTVERFRPLNFSAKYVNYSKQYCFLFKCTFYSNILFFVDNCHYYFFASHMRVVGQGRDGMAFHFM